MNKINEKRLNEDIYATKQLMIRNAGKHSLLSQLTGASPFTKNSNYESLYVNATEDIPTYSKQFANAKSILTIGASGEQAINAIDMGIKNIDVFDSNRLCRHALSLRIAAIQALTLEEYLNFYKTFDCFLFIKIANYLEHEELMYWGTLYSMFGKDNTKSGDIINDLLFTYRRLDEELIRKINPYLTKDKFAKLKGKISEVTINFIDSDLYNLPKHIEGKQYDAISLSNIYEYLNYDSSVSYENAVKYRSFIFEKMYQHLNESGAMVVSYFYAWSHFLNEDFKKMYRENNCQVTAPGALSIYEYQDYLRGLTTQNLAYSYLMEACANDPIIYVPTNHIQYGQSKDMSHDLALILKK